MQAGMKLESFDMAEVADPGPNPDYENGYAAGFADATTVAAAADERLRQDLVQALTDMTFTYREAQQDIMESLRGLITALIQSILPHCITESVTRQIVDLVLATQTATSSKTITVHVHPDQLCAVQGATAEIGEIVTVMTDASLTPNAAWIGQAGAETYLDMDQLLAEISAILTSLTDYDQRKIQNG